MLPILNIKSKQEKKKTALPRPSGNGCLPMLLPLSGSTRLKPKTRPHSLRTSAAAFKVTARSGDALEFNFRQHTPDYFPSGAAVLGAAPLTTPSATPLASLCVPWLERAGGAWPRGRSAPRVGPGASPSAVTRRHAPSGRAGARARAPAALYGDVPGRGRARALELLQSGCHGVGGAS